VRSFAVVGFRMEGLPHGKGFRMEGPYEGAEVPLWRDEGG
jgi:hypothetical protein